MQRDGAREAERSGEEILLSASAAETESAGYRLGRELAPGEVVSLCGSLGCGKTVFVKGMARAFGVEEAVTSPTFVIVHEYRGRLPFLHMDLYRLKSAAELEDIGFRDYLATGGVTAIEWGEKASSVLPDRRIEVTFSILPDERREIRWRRVGP